MLQRQTGRVGPVTWVWRRSLFAIEPRAVLAASDDAAADARASLEERKVIHVGVTGPLLTHGHRVDVVNEHGASVAFPKKPRMSNPSRSVMTGRLMTGREAGLRAEQPQQRAREQIAGDMHDVLGHRL